MWVLCGSGSRLRSAAALRLADWRVAAAIIAAGLLLATPAWSRPDPSLEPLFNESLLLVPSQGDVQPSLEATLFMPDGAGPFPLAVLNHGTLNGPSRQQRRWRPLHLVLGWLQRGYAVLLPNRAGYANSGGGEANPACPAIAERARDGGAQIARSIDALAARHSHDIDFNRIVMLGHSDGALSTLGYAGQAHPGLRVAVNLAGGLRSSLSWCAWQDMLTDSMQELAPAAAQVPVMWLYAENDSFFGPALAERMFRSWKKAGGQAVLRLLPPLGNDGHNAVIEPAGLDAVWPKLDALLAAAKLPTAVVQPRFIEQPEPVPAASGFATIDAVDRLPHVGDRQREIYRNFLRQSLPRAFALSPDGAVGWANDSYPTQRAALRWCNASAAPGRPCRLYAVDDRVVWLPDAAADAPNTAKTPTVETTAPARSPSTSAAVPAPLPAAAQASSPTTSRP